MSRSVIIFSANYLPHVGGVENYTFELSMELISTGRKVIIVTSEIDSLPSKEVHDHLVIFRLSTKWFLNQRMPVTIPGRRWREVKKELGKEENPFVIIQTYLYPLSLYAALFCQKKNWSSLLISHGSDYVCQGDGFIDYVEHDYERRMSRFISRRCSMVGAVSARSQKWLMQFGIDCNCLIPNGINPKKIEHAIYGEKIYIRNKYGISEDTFLVCFIGRMIKEKGILQLVQSIIELRKEGKKIALIAIGDGPLLTDLKKEDNDGIFFTGRMDHDDVLKVIIDCDCHCLPSDSEGFSTTVLEASFCDCFNIITQTNGAVMLISNSHYGYVMKNNSKEDIKEAILFCYNNKELCEESIQNCKKKLLEQYTWEKICKKVLIIERNLK